MMGPGDDAGRATMRMHGEVRLVVYVDVAVDVALRLLVPT